MASISVTHYDREQSVLNDIESSFPNFTGKHLAWVHVPSPNDPPDFIATTSSGMFGLEFREWLDDAQTSAASGRAKQRAHLVRIIGTGWEQEYQPISIALASIEPRWGLRVRTADEAGLRQEFYKCATHIDQTWSTNPDRRGRRYHQMEFPGCPLMTTYLKAINYIDGQAHGLIWMQIEDEGGVCDPFVPAQTLENALAHKLTKFNEPSRKAKIAAQNLSEHDLLIHGGWNTYTKNTPYEPLTLRQISKRGADLYEAHPLRDTFDRVWFYDSLDSADDINALLGIPAGAGRMRWLAQLWPSFVVYEGSSE
jgi:hypothetical protein